jgi:hypothetical protein
MKLSEALRAGAVGRKQGIEAIYDPGDDTYCALGMALAALGVEFGDEPVVATSFRQEALIYEGCGVDRGVELPCPCGCGSAVDILDFVVVANDVLEWDAERIAAWLEEQGL